MAGELIFFSIGQSEMTVGRSLPNTTLAGAMAAPGRKGTR